LAAALQPEWDLVPTEMCRKRAELLQAEHLDLPGRVVQELAVASAVVLEAEDSVDEAGAVSVVATGNGPVSGVQARRPERRSVTGVVKISRFTDKLLLRSPTQPWMPSGFR
jgi:hypothetical protein